MRSCAQLPARFVSREFEVAGTAGPRATRSRASLRMTVWRTTFSQLQHFQFFQNESLSTRIWQCMWLTRVKIVLHNRLRYEYEYQVTLIITAGRTLRPSSR